MGCSFIAIGPLLMESVEGSVFWHVKPLCPLTSSRILPCRECSCVGPAAAVCGAYCYDHPAAPECLSRFSLVSCSQGIRGLGLCHLLDQSGGPDTIVHSTATWVHSRGGL